MADTTSKHVQELYLRLVEQIEGGGSVARALEQTDRACKKSTQALEKYRKSLTETDEAKNKLYKTTVNIKKAFGNLFGRTLALGAAGMAAVAISIKQTGEALVDLKVQSADGSAALTQLQNSYDSLKKTSASTTLTMREAAKSVAEFAGKSLAHAVIAGQSDVQKGLIGMSNMLKTYFGDDETLKKAADSMGKQFGSTRSMLEDIGKQMEGIMSGGKTPEGAKKIAALRQQLEKYLVTASAFGDPKPINDLLNQMGMVEDYYKGTGSSAVNATMAMHDAMRRLQQVIGSLQEKLLTTFGPYITKAIQIFSDFIDKTWKKIEANFEGFDVESFGNKLNYALETASEWVSKLISGVSSLVSWFLKLPTIAQLPLLGLFLAGPGNVGKGIIGVVQTMMQLKGLGRMKGLTDALCGTCPTGAAGAASTAGRFAGRLLPAASVAGTAALGVVAAGATAAAIQATYSSFRGGIGTHADEDWLGFGKSTDRIAGYDEQGNKNFGGMSAEQKRQLDMKSAAKMGLSLEQFEAQRAARQVKRAAEVAAAQKKAAEAAKAVAQEQANLKAAAAALAQLKAEAEGLREQLEGVAEVSDMIPDLFAAFGNINMLPDDLISSNVSAGVAKSLEAMEKGRALIAKSDSMSGDSKEQIEAKQKLRLEGMRMMQAAGRALGSVGKEITANEEQQLQYQNLRTQGIKLELEKRKALLGTAAMSLETMMQVVEQLKTEETLLTNEDQKLKALIADNLAKADAEMAAAKAAKTEEDKTAAIQRANDLRSATYQWQKQELEISNKIKQNQLDQLNNVKELQAGYLNAVQAQAFGAGKFSKLLIDQEKNIGMSLDKRMTKQNFLLGSNKGPGVGPTRVTGFGEMTDVTTGGAVNTEEQKRLLAQSMTPTERMALAGTDAMAKRYLQSTDKLVPALGMGQAAAGVMAGEAARQAAEGRMGVVPRMPTSISAPSGGTTTAPASTSTAGGGGKWTQQMSTAAQILIAAGQKIDEMESVAVTPQRMSRIPNVVS